MSHRPIVRDDADVMEQEDERQDCATDQQLHIEDIENLDCIGCVGDCSKCLKES